MQQPNQLCQMTIRCKQRDFLAFYSTSRESWNYFPVLLGQGPFCITFLYSAHQLFTAHARRKRRLWEGPILRWSWLIIWNAIQYNKSAICRPVLSRALRFRRVRAVRSYKALGTRLDRTGGVHCTNMTRLNGSFDLHWVRLMKRLTFELTLCELESWNRNIRHGVKYCLLIREIWFIYLDSNYNLKFLSRSETESHFKV